MAYMPGQSGGQPPQQPHVVYVSHPAAQGTSIDRVTVPLLLVVSAGAFIAWASWFGTTSINSIQSSVKDISVTLNNYIDRQDERVNRLETVVERRNGEAWTKDDQALFCARTEAIPQNKGWKCGETEGGRASLDSPSIWQGHLSGQHPVADVTIPPAIGRWSQPKVRATP